MKKVLLLTLMTGLFCSTIFAQKKHAHKPKAATTTAPATATVDPKNDTLLPYQKNPKFPIFRIQQMDSVTIFNTSNIPEGKPVLLFYFGAECDHCTKLLERLLPSFDSLSDIRIYMATFSPLTPIKTFYEKYNLSKYKNLEIGRDYEFAIGPIYGAKSVPCLALYDKHKRFVKKWEGQEPIRTLTVKEIYEAAHPAK